MSVNIEPWKVQITSTMEQNDGLGLEVECGWRDRSFGDLGVYVYRVMWVVYRNAWKSSRHVLTPSPDVSDTC